MIARGPISGMSLAGVVVALVLLGTATLGLVRYAASVGQFRRELDTRGQENAYRVFQQELSVLGVDPTALAPNPLAGAATVNPPNPTLSYISTASRDQPGSARVAAFAASPDLAGRSGALGFRISATGTAVAPPPATALQPPTFRVSGLVPESEFNPDLQNWLAPNPANPAGTIYRYTLDGTAPSATSPAWTASSAIVGAPLPALVRAAAFHSDPLYAPSAVVEASLARSLALTYGRTAGGNSTSFTYAEVTGAWNQIALGVTGNLAGLSLYYTYDGSVPTAAAHLYSGPFHVPPAAWSATVALRVIAVTPSSNIVIAPLDVTLTPAASPLPAPTFGPTSGTPTAVVLRVSDAVAGARIRYDLDRAVTALSPEIPNGASITIAAP